MPQSIPPAVIRRVNRVRARIETVAEEPDVVLDDIFVLCRAFEGTWTGVGGERQQAEEATIETVAGHGISALPRVRALVTKMRAFVGASSEEFSQWFGSEHRPASEVKREVLAAIRTLQEAVSAGRWTSNDSRKLGKLIYRMRCAVIHPSLDTQSALAYPVLTSLRDALIELTMARAATRYGVALPETIRQFDLALPRV